MPVNDADLLELAIRQRLDPCLLYRPGPTIARFHASKARYRWIGGKNRGGKTTGLINEVVLCARRLHPTRTVTKNGVYLLLAPARDQLQDPWGVRLLEQSQLKGECYARPYIPPWEIKPDGIKYTHGGGRPTVKEIQLLNGHTIKFSVTKDVGTWKRKQGQNYLGIALDESEVSKDLIMEMYRGLLDSNSDDDIVREAGGGWLAWGATETTTNAPLQEFITLCENPEQNDWEGFRLTKDENPAIKAEEREKLRVAFTEEDYQVRMEGTEGYADRLAIYGKQWNDARHMRTTDYIVQPEDNLWCAYDPGGAGAESHDTGIVFAAINKAEPTKLRFVHCIKLNRTILSYDFKRIAHFLRGRTLEGFVPDIATNKTEKATGKTIRWQMKEEMSRQKIKSYRGIVTPMNRHDPGIKRVQTYLDENLIELNPSKESGCMLLRQQMLSYSSYEEGVYQGARGVVKKDDDLVDPLRYLIMAINAGRTRLCYVPRGCGEAQWSGAERPPPPIEIIVPLTVDQENFQAQLERSRRIAGSVGRRRMRN